MGIVTHPWRLVRRRRDGRRIADDITNAMSDLSQSVERLMPPRDRVILHWWRFLRAPEAVFALSARDLSGARPAGDQRYLFAGASGHVALVDWTLLRETYAVTDQAECVFQSDDGSAMDCVAFFASMARSIGLENAFTREDDPDGRSITPSSNSGVGNLGFKTRVNNAKVFEAEVYSGALDRVVRYRFFVGEAGEDTRGWMCVADKAGPDGWIPLAGAWRADTEEEALSDAQVSILQSLGEVPFSS